MTTTELATLRHEAIATHNPVEAQRLSDLYLYHWGQTHPSAADDDLEHEAVSLAEAWGAHGDGCWECRA